MAEKNPSQALWNLQGKHEYFVGIDSDGCVFDTMGIKQRECFCPAMIGCFGLQPVAEAARECKVFTDLFSKTRGVNRHKAIRRILMELLPTHPMVKARGFKVPEYKYYCQWVDDPDSLLSDAGLKQAIEKAQNPQARQELQAVLRWSEKANALITDIVKGIPPFPYVRKSLQVMGKQADLVVVSATPCEALQREWQEHDVDQYVALIAGQEMGTKKQHLEYATKDKYAQNHVLMIGDAPGDMKAAKANKALFYPINPGNEDQSWKRLYEEAFDRFIKGTYAGDYEKKLIDEFDSYLPDNPPWQK